MATALRLEILLEAVDRLTAPLARTRAAIAGVAQAAQRIGQSSGAGLLGRSLGQVAEQARAATGAVAGLAGRTAAIGTGAAIGGVLAFNRSFLGVASSFEQLNVRLITATGSQERAAEAMNYLRGVAAASPQTLREVTDAYIRLQGSVRDVPRYFNAVSDAANANGRTLEQAAEAFNDATRGEFERLKEFGVNVQRENDTLTFNYTRHGEQRVAVIRNASRAMIADTLRAIWSDAHDGATERAARTWDGMVSMLRDAWDDFAKRVMDAGVFDWLKGRLSEILASIGRMAEDGRLQAFAERVAAQFLRAFEAMRTFLVGTEDAPSAIERAEILFNRIASVVNWLSERFGGANVAIAGLAVVFGGQIIAAIAALAASFVTLGIVLAATPIGWLIGAVGLLAGAAVLLVRNWQPIGAFFESLWDGITERFAAAWEAIRPIVDAIGGALGRLTGSGEGALTQPAAQAERRQRFGGRGALGGFPMPPGLEEMERNAAAAANLAQRPELRVETGGRVEIVVEDNRVQTRARPNDPGTRYDVRQGLSMVQP